HQECDALDLQLPRPIFRLPAIDLERYSLTSAGGMVHGVNYRKPVRTETVLAHDRTTAAVLFKIV
ncbi:MAG: hypothetical protein WCP86_06610, partial [bacterium]